MHKKTLHFVILFTMFFTVPFLYSNEKTLDYTAHAHPKAEQNDAENFLSSPRDSIRLFMSVMNEAKIGNTERLNEAYKTMDLSHIPQESASTRNFELANQLFSIMNEFTFSIDNIEVEETQTLYQLPIGEELGLEIILEKNNNAWQFSHEKTLSKLSEFALLVKKSTTNNDTIHPILSSPRATMQSFLETINKVKTDGYQPVIQTFDMSKVERALHTEIGRERAVMLKSVIDRYKYIDLVELPNSPDGPTYTYLAHPAGKITIEQIEIPETNTKAWKFSSSTLEALPALYDAFRDKPLITEIDTEIEIPLTMLLRNYVQQSFPSLLKRVLIIENWQWLGIFAVFFIGLLLSKLLSQISQKLIDYVFSKEELSVKKESRTHFLKPAAIFYTSLLWWLGFSLLSLPAALRIIIVLSTRLAATITGIIATYRLMDIVGDLLMGRAIKTENKYDDLLVPFITRSLKLFVITVGLVIIADAMAFDINKILAGLGIGGLAFALAAQDTISNLFGSLTILIDRPFQIGDWVTIGNVDGIVESVGVRSTRIRTFHNSLVTLPNSQLINASIDNWGAREYRRISCDISISYKTLPAKIDAFCEGIREIIRLQPYTRKDFFIVNLNEFGQSSLKIMLYCFVKAPDWGTELREKHRLFNAIIKLADSLSIEFAITSHNLYLRQDQEPKQKNVPVNQDAAFEQGKTSAAKIVYEELGEPTKVPPPVKF